MIVASKRDPEIQELHELDLVRQMRRATGIPNLWAVRYPMTGVWSLALLSLDGELIWELTHLNPYDCLSREMPVDWYHQTVRSLRTGWKTATEKRAEARSHILEGQRQRTEQEDEYAEAISGMARHIRGRWGNTVADRYIAATNRGDLKRATKTAVGV